MSQNEEPTSNYQIPDDDIPQVTDVQYSVEVPNSIQGLKEKTTMSQNEEQTSNYQIPDDEVPQVTDVKYSVGEPNHIQENKDKTKYYCSEHPEEPICNWIKE